MSSKQTAEPTQPIHETTPTTPTKSLIRWNYHEESEKAVNQLINSILNVCDGILVMVYYFKRVDNFQIGFSDFYDCLSKEHYWLARRVMDYQIERGGRVLLTEITPPERQMEWNSGLDSLNNVLKRLQNLNLEFVQLHTLAQNHNDPHLQHFVEENLLEQSIETIYRVANKINKFRRAGTSDLAQYVTDRDLKEFVEEEEEDESTTTSTSASTSDEE